MLPYGCGLPFTGTHRPVLRPQAHIANFKGTDTAVTNIVGIRAYGTSLREAKPLILTLCSSSCETDFVCFAERTHRRDGGF